MLKFGLNVEERKTLVKRMEELTGIHTYYTKAPRYAHDIGNFPLTGMAACWWKQKMQMQAHTTTSIRLYYTKISQKSRILIYKKSKKLIVISCIVST